MDKLKGPLGSESMHTLADAPFAQEGEKNKIKSGSTTVAVLKGAHAAADATDYPACQKENSQ